MPHFRRATITDVQTIVKMLADDALGSNREDESPSAYPAYKEAFEAIDADQNQLLAVMEENGTVIGSLQLTFIPGLSQKGLWRGQIEGVRVASHLRGKGYGRMLLKWAIDQCRDRGCRSVQLTSNKSRTNAIEFYESLGFTVSHEGLKLPI